MKRPPKTGLIFGILFVSLAAVSVPNEAQVVSPPARAVCKFADGKTITANYSSPRRRGRKIFGDLVPYGEVWRAGADDATSFVPNVDVTVGDKAVPAGRYTLFALPAQTKWTLILSKVIGEWGIPYPGANHDFGRMDMKVSRLPAPLENFTISFDQAGNTCSMKLDWETTRASIDIAEKK
ncbi:MAG TPA: DUF2911 domain-containing protein [Verrucomicrobiae bacterium]|jgi:hypothetical protein|nr:DUF2911 domain-containing protein [Verrucomicrobiae bacterium]